MILYGVKFLQNDKVLSLFCELQTEHTEGVRKLNFVVSLVDAILEVISARGTPFTVLTESVAIRQVSVAMICHSVSWIKLVGFKLWAISLF